MKNLINEWFQLISEWRSALPQERTAIRVFRLAFGCMCAFGRRTLSRSIAATGHDQQDWSADYKVFSRSDWSVEDLFRPILKKAITLCDEDIIGVAFDDTKLHKTGRKIKSAFWQRDPLSPPFHVNMIWGLRFLQASILLPLYRSVGSAPRAIPVQFTEIPAIKKPGKKANQEELAIYKKNKKQNNLSIGFVDRLRALRKEMDVLGYSDKKLLSVVDGSFCNRTAFSHGIEGVNIIARARKDAALCFREKNNQRRFYGTKFTPEMVRQDELIPWKTARVFHGGEWRIVRFKEIEHLFWKRGCQRKPVRLIVLAPTPYRLSRNQKIHYREPAYLLTDNKESSAEILVQKYFDRWQIEVNFREEKSLLGVGEAQVRADKSVPRQPAFVVAAYSALLLSSVILYEDKRDKSLMLLPKWRQRSHRPSIVDLITQLRREAPEDEFLSKYLGVKFSIIEAAKRAVA